MIVEAMIKVLVLLLVLAGTALSSLSSLGLLRLPDVYTRAHATTKSTTLGILSILTGAFIYFWGLHDVMNFRLLLGIVFVFLTAPVSGHFIIRSAHRSGVALADISVRDDLLEDLRRQARATGESLVRRGYE